MSYTNVTVRDRQGTVIIQNATAELKDGKLTVAGTLESGQSLTVDVEYRITGDTGLNVKGPYTGSPGPGKFNFKID